MNVARHLGAPHVPLGLRNEELLDRLRDDEDAMVEAHKAATADLESVYERLGSGAQRTVFESKCGKVVYKIARTNYDWGDAEECMDANLAEVARFENGYDGIPVAPCRIVWHESGVPIVVMEKLDKPQHECDDEGVCEDVPWWSHRVDGSQIGWSNLLGCWAVYDAGIDNFMNSDEIERLAEENEQGEQAA